MQLESKSASAPGTATGLVCCEVFPMPSCPLTLPPQHLTPPPSTIAHVWLAPKAMAVAETPAAIKGSVGDEWEKGCALGDACWDETEGGRAG